MGYKTDAEVANLPDQQLARHPISEKRLPALDGIRGLAVLGVLVVHAQILLDSTQPVERSVSRMVEVGAYGVDLFFVLSGFLITGILLDTTQSVNYFRGFYARRFLRLFPVYYGYLLVVMLVFPAIHRAVRTSIPDYGGSWAWYLSYLSNWKPGHGASDPFLEHFWSLAVEEQFYLVWPAMILLVPRRKLVYVFAGIIAIAVFLRIGMAAQGTFWNTLYRLTPTRMDALALGALAALAIRSEVWRPRLIVGSRRIIMVSGALFCLTAIVANEATWKSRWIQTTGSLCIEIAFAGLVFTAAAFEAGFVHRLGTTPWLMACGKYSYTMYVIHVAVYYHLVWLISWVNIRFSVPLPLPFKAFYTLLMMAAVFCLAALSWRFIESPLLSLKKRFPY